MTHEFNGQVIRISLAEAVAEDSDYNIGLPTGGYMGSEADIRAHTTNLILNDILAKSQQNSVAAYLLRWEGNTNIPRGAVIGEHTVAWTQSTLVINDQNQCIGTYRRIKDRELEDRALVSEMLIFPYPLGVFPEPQANQ